MVDSRRINAVLTTDVSGQEVIIYRGDAYYKRVACTRMANAGKHCVEKFNSIIDPTQRISAIPSAVTAEMLAAGTHMANSTAARYLVDMQRMCEGKKTVNIPESRIRRYAWEASAVAFLRTIDEVA